MFDWKAFEAALLDALLAAAAATYNGPYRAAALSDLYAETDDIITAPMLGLNTDGEQMDSPPDWEFFLDDWAPDSWIEALTAEACSATVEHWKATFERYQEVLVRVCRHAGARLGIPVFYIEHSRYEEMLGRCLTPAQLAELFPEVVATQAERARVAALPLDERLAFYVSHLDRFDGLIGPEEAANALCALGPDAIPALLPLLGQPERTWRAAHLLATIGIATSPVIAALSAAVSESIPDSPDQLWSCRALAQLDRLDLVLANASTLSPDAVATAVAARYTSFRDSGARPLPLDYSPLEDFLRGYPEIVPNVADELAPGGSYCTITVAEVPEAMRGTTSPHPVVRKHAVCVLGERALGESIGAQVIPLLRDIARSDTDSDVRRLAALSLSWWKVD